jgi:hypothetical protein
MINRTLALRKLGIKSKIFDWLCFLLGVVSFIPRKLEKVAKNYYLNIKSLNIVKNSIILKKVHYIQKWKNRMKARIKKQNTDKIDTMNEQMPTYNLDEVIKKRFPNFSNAFEIFYESFILYFLEAGFNSNILFKENCFNVRNIFYFETTNLLTTKPMIRKLFRSEDSLHFEAILGGKRRIFIIPKNFNSYKRIARFEIYLYEFFENIYHIVLKKFILLRKKKKLYQINKIQFENFAYIFSDLKRFYTYPKKKSIHGNISISNFSRFNEYPSIFPNNVQFTKLISAWAYSKNILFHYKNNIFSKIVFSKSMIKKYVDVKFLLFSNSSLISDIKNEHFITHIFSDKLIAKKSLTSCIINLKWISDLMAFRSKILYCPQNYLGINIKRINPFYIEKKSSYIFCNENNNRKKFKEKKNFFNEFYTKKKIIFFREISHCHPLSSGDYSLSLILLSV